MIDFNATIIKDYNFFTYMKIHKYIKIHDTTWVF